MLAPLTDRSLIEQESPGNQPATTDPVAELRAENAALRVALQLARRDQRLGATRAARKIVAQENELLRLQTLLDASRQRVAALESGQAIVDLGRRLMQLSAINEDLVSAARRVWILDKTLCAAHAECERIATERDRLAGQLAANRSPGRKQETER